MIILFIIVITLLLASNIALGYFLYRSAQRLFEFDDLYEMLVHDIDTNINYFTKLVNTALLSNSPEILEAQRNMRIMRDRLEEYVLRMEELAKRKMRVLPKSSNPPVVA